jgi:hypothetical protein
VVVLAGDVQITVAINEVVSTITAARVTRVDVGQDLGKSLTGKYNRPSWSADVDRFDRLAAGEEDDSAGHRQTVRPPAIVRSIG